MRSDQKVSCAIANIQCGAGIEAFLTFQFVHKRRLWFPGAMLRLISHKTGSPRRYFMYVNSCHVLGARQLSYLYFTVTSTNLTGPPVAIRCRDHGSLEADALWEFR